jgi:cytochrome b561
MNTVEEVGMMPARNTHDRYGWMSLWLHWLMALGIIVLYGLGLWIDEMTYSDPLYQTIPLIHESMGILLLAMLVFRYVWRLINIEPFGDDLKPLERLAAKIAHRGLYVLILALSISGYLISTADGRAIDVFDWFQLPSLMQARHQEDIAGDVHEILADAVLIIAAIHALAALKHHYLDGGDSLRRMLPSFGKSD